MNRLLIAVLFALSASSLATVCHAGGGAGAPLCPTTSSPDCVQSNWGQTEPEGVDSSLAPHTGGLAARATGGSHAAVQMLAVGARATSGLQQSGAPLKTVVSPINLFPKETAALVSAIREARFNADGSIVSGQDRISAAAAEAARAAGTRYTLTLFIKVTPRLKPDETGLLGKKVQSINDVLSSASRVTTNKPQG